MIEVIFGAFAIAALLQFGFVAPARAVTVTCFAGWLILPVGNFPAGSAEAVFPYWITGAAVPSDMLLTKMWWPPVVALVGALWMDRETLARWRPDSADLPMLLWCLWPIVQWPLVASPEPQPWIASLYLGAAWGAPWFLGRVYFSGREGGRRLIGAIVAGLVVITPIALLEGVLGPKVYGWLYEPHPFRFDGSQRDFGFRPLGFFEDGNQYGIWVAATALAAIWLWKTAPRSQLWPPVVAVLAVAVALMSQSVGALILLFTGLAFSWAMGRRLAKSTLFLIVLLTAGGAAIYLSGALPLRTLATDTVIGRRVVDLVRSTGRGSIIWRIARDQDALPIIEEHPIVGTARWDWWRKNGERPWGLALLIFGQFGLVGLVLSFGSLLVPVLRAFDEGWNLRKWRPNSPAPPLGLIVLMALADGLLNSFFFYPAILAAGSLLPRLEHCEPGREPCELQGPEAAEMKDIRKIEA